MDHGGGDAPYPREPAFSEWAYHARYACAVGEVSIGELCNHGGDVVDRAAGGEPIVITRAGKSVARLMPVGSAPLTAEALLERWRRVPPGDPERLRADIDAVIDPCL